MKVKQMATVAVTTAVVCVLGPLAVPVGPVPITLCVLGIFLAVYLLGMRGGTLAVLLYLLIGMAGLPVFSGFSAGPGKLLGPTGGYLVGYIFMALIAGFFIDRFEKKWYLQFAGMALGLAALYAFGTVWLAVQAHMTFAQALWAGVIPFVAFDLCKLAAALAIGRVLKARLRQAALLGAARA